MTRRSSTTSVFLSTLIVTAFCVPGIALAKTAPTQQTPPIVTTNLSQWTGLGDIAILYNGQSDSGIGGGTLYTLLNVGPAGSAKATMHRIADHVQTATFSPDGRWLAVVESSAGTKPNQAPSESGWLMAADGRSQQRIWTGNDRAGSWVQNAGVDTYVFGQNRLFSVTPGHAPTPVGPVFPETARLNRIDFRKGSEVAAVSVTYVPGRRPADYMKAYDVIGTWAAGDTQFRPWLRSKAGNGLVLGPWTADGKGLFYWDNPLHSASLLSDGTELHEFRLVRDKTIAVALSDSNAVTPTTGQQALIRVGPSRYWYDTKHLALWDGQHLRTLPSKPGTVQNWPSVSADGTTVAYAEGKALREMPSSKMVLAWWRQSTLHTMNLKTGQSHTLAAAGQGVLNPRFNADGTRIIYTKGNTLLWIRTDGTGHSNQVMKLAAPVWNTYPQAAPQSMDVADYLPSPIQ